MHVRWKRRKPTVSSGSWRWVNYLIHIKLASERGNALSITSCGCKTTCKQHSITETSQSESFSIFRKPSTWCGREESWRSCQGWRSAAGSFNWIDDFLSERTFQVRVGDQLSNVSRLDNGTPQGSRLSPLLFLIQINDFRNLRSVRSRPYMQTTAQSGGPGKIWKIWK